MCPGTADSASERESWPRSLTKLRLKEPWQVYFLREVNVLWKGAHISWSLWFQHLFKALIPWCKAHSPLFCALSFYTLWCEDFASLWTFIQFISKIQCAINVIILVFDAFIVTNFSSRNHALEVDFVQCLTLVISTCNGKFLLYYTQCENQCKGLFIQWCRLLGHNNFHLTITRIKRYVW